MNLIKRLEREIPEHGDFATIVEKFESKSQNSPFVGKMVLGKIKKTICNGKVIYSDEV